MDSGEAAQAYEAFYLKVALTNQAARSDSNGAANLYCEGCGERIPEERRRAIKGCKRCVFCQRKREPSRA